MEQETFSTNASHILCRACIELFLCPENHWLVRSCHLIMYMYRHSCVSLKSLAWLSDKRHTFPVEHTAVLCTMMHVDRTLIHDELSYKSQVHTLLSPTDEASVIGFCETSDVTRQFFVHVFQTIGNKNKTIGLLINICDKLWCIKAINQWSNKLQIYEKIITNTNNNVNVNLHKINHLWNDTSKSCWNKVKGKWWN